MKITKDDLGWAVAQGLLSEEQKASLWEALTARDKNRPKFDLVHIGYYVGALIVILAMTWFLAISWDKWGHAGIVMISSVYAIVLWIAGARCWKKEDLRTPGGLLLTVTVCMVPIIVYGLQSLFAIGPTNSYSYHYWLPESFGSCAGNRVVMELWTIIAAILMIRMYPFPFLLAPLSWCLWAMSLDLAALIIGNQYYWWDTSTWVSVAFGLAMLFCAYFIDLKKKTTQDYAFWLYLFGTMAYWGALCFMHKTEPGEFAFAIINVGLMLLSVLLQRKTLMVFGALGLIGYLCHLAWNVFRDMMMFPIAMSLVGIGIIMLAVKYQRNQAIIHQAILSWIPDSLKPWIPERAES